ncbi:MAG: hypothetical protein P1U63_04685 [Coxiellaceae bacterium]|nr:hypothetical protein [Coxiellaceae bacterium]
MEYLSPFEAFKVSLGVGTMGAVFAFAAGSMLQVTSGLLLDEQSLNQNVSLELLVAFFSLFAFATSYSLIVEPDALAYRGIVERDFFPPRRAARQQPELPAERETEAVLPQASPVA